MREVIDKYELAKILRNAAREYLELKEGDRWDFGIAEAQASALIELRLKGGATHA